MSGVRSAAPIGVQALRDLPTIYDYFWEHGTVNLGEDSNAQPEYPNPAFASSPNQTLTLHYGLDPLLGFHLATAYAPLNLQSPSLPKPHETSSVKALVQAAQQQFCEWSKSFRQSIANGSILRFFAGDAIAFCHTLQQAGSAVGNRGANLYCDSWTFHPLKLDVEDYKNAVRVTPLKFDVIDTSNLVDHLGALHILVAAAPLLADRVTSTLYTEVLVQHESSVQSMVDNILSGHFETVSLLMGLSSVESWTNANAAADVEEGMFKFVWESTKVKAGERTTQVRTRLRWKKLSALSRTYFPSQESAHQLSTEPEIDAQSMSRLLYFMYQAMFCHEDLRTLVASIKVQGVGKLSNPYYSRASFAALLRHVKNNVVVDWEETLKLFLDILEKNVSPISISRNYLQELNLYLHLSGMYTVQALRDGAPGMFNLGAAQHLQSWDHVPSVLCISFEVPAKNLKAIKDKPLGTLGTPSLCCTVQSSRTSLQQWANNFSAVQIAFGNISPVGRKGDADFHLDVNEDLDGWAGTSSLVVSFFIPTWILLQEPHKALVACGLQNTPHTSMAFAKDLGLELRVFETNLGDDRRIHVTKFMPHMSGHPIFGASGSNMKSSSSSAETGFRKTSSANVAADGSQITGLTCKIDFHSVTAKTKLSDKTSLVELSSQSPMAIEVIVGRAIRCRAQFPLPVSISRTKLRIARKSSYVEVVAPLLRPLDADASPRFMFPVSVISAKTAAVAAVPANWNMPYVNLNVLPVLDTKIVAKMQWLVTHASLMWSSREREIRKAGMSRQDSSNLQKDDRVEFKDGLFSLFMLSTGLQGGPTRVFALHRPAAGGVHVLLFVSAIKLDLANHTVVLDTAVLPLSHKILRDGLIQKFLGGIQESASLPQNRTIGMINVTETELKLWKQVLPAWAERCRTWKHKSASCEYLLTGEVPPPESLEEGDTPLCSCGNGQLPPKFMVDLKLPHLDYVLQKYATRIAISPVFSVQHVEECYLHDVPLPTGGRHKPEAVVPSAGERCTACGSDKKKASSATTEALLTCTRCKTTKYCSKECQRADWKNHKQVCRPL